METEITPERRRQLAAQHGVNEQYLYQCLSGRRDMGPAEAVRLYIATKGELRLDRLCQRTHASIWPHGAPSLEQADQSAGEKAGA